MRDMHPGGAHEDKYIILKKEVIPFKDETRGSYLSLSLINSAGQLEARQWELPSNHYDLVPGIPVHLKAIVEEFRGTIQLRILTIAPLLESDIDLTELLPASPGRAEMESELAGAIQGIADPEIRNMLLQWLGDSEVHGLYITAPAAKQMHHARIGGLLEHSLEVLKLSQTMVRLYGADESLVTAGALLHDVGKTVEYSWLPTIDFTDQGRLLGHITLGYNMLNHWGTGLPQAKLQHLGHIILSHHGEIEYGSPIRPLTLEAMIVHQADLASGRLRPAADAIAAPGANSDWTAYEKALGRSFYRGFIAK